MRFTTTLACMMDLHYYPLDSQNCTVEIESCKLPFTFVRCTLNGIHISNTYVATGYVHYRYIKYILDVHNVRVSARGIIVECNQTA